MIGVARAWDRYTTWKVGAKLEPMYDSQNRTLHIGLKLASERFEPATNMDLHELIGLIWSVEIISV